MRGGAASAVPSQPLIALPALGLVPAMRRHSSAPCFFFIFVIRNTRIRVKEILDLLAAGASHDEILEGYPPLEPGDITAVLEYAARQNDHPVLSVA